MLWWNIEAIHDALLGQVAWVNKESKNMMIDSSYNQHKKFDSIPHNLAGTGPTG